MKYFIPQNDSFVETDEDTFDKTSTQIGEKLTLDYYYETRINNTLVTLEVCFDGELDDDESVEDFLPFTLVYFDLDVADQWVYDLPGEDVEKPIKEARFKSLQEMQPVYDAWLAEIKLREELGD